MLEYSFPRLFVPWNIRSHDGTFVLGTIDEQVTLQLDTATVGKYHMRGNSRKLRP